MFTGVPTAVAEDAADAAATAAVTEPEAKAQPAEEPETKSEPAEEPEAKSEPAEEPAAKSEPAEEPEATPEPTPDAKPATEPEAAPEPTGEPEGTTEPTGAPEATTEPTGEPEPTGVARTSVVEPVVEQTVKVSKVAKPVPLQTATGQWRLTYLITVTNASASGSARYDLDDALDFGAYLVADQVQVNPPAGVTPVAGWTGSGDHTLIASGVTLLAGEKHEYMVLVLASVRQKALAAGTWTCDAGGFGNRATVLEADTSKPWAEPAFACVQPTFPEVDKTDGTATRNPDGSWAVSFRITVTNPSGAAMPVTLTDVWPTLPAGWTAQGGVATVTPLDGAPITNTTSAASPLWSGSLPRRTTYAYLVQAVLVPAEDADPIGSCAAGDGLVNKAKVISGEVWKVATDCVDIEFAKLTVTKSDGRVTQLADFSWQVDYTVTVTNPAAIATTYTLTDTPDLGTGFTGTGAWLGTAPTANTPIAAGASHDYTYRVLASFDPATEDAELSCKTDGAFFNTATVSFPGGKASDDGCAEPASPTVLKTALAPELDPATGKWTLSYRLTVTNPSALELAYELGDEVGALPSGVTGGGWTASGPTMVGGGTAVADPAWAGTGQLATGTLPAGAVHEYTVQRTVSVAAGARPADLECESGGVWNTAVVTNGVGGNKSTVCSPTGHYDDLAITKTHSTLSGQDFVGVGEEFDYLLTVTNKGTRAATGVVVSDPVPDRLEVVGLDLPSGWVNANAPAMVDGDGRVTVSTPTLGLGASADLRIRVRVLPRTPLAAGALSGLMVPTGSDLVNQACVAADHDQDTTNDCDDDLVKLPRSAQLQITKTADVTTSVPGESFEYTLLVQNAEAAGVADGVVVTDPIPAPLRVDSVSVASSPASPSWDTCEVTGQDARGYGGTLSCDLSGPLHPGESAPEITLGVTIDPETVATAIDNVAAVDYHAFGDPSDTGHDEDGVSVELLYAVAGDSTELGEDDPAELALTGAGDSGGMLGVALAAMLAGTFLMFLARRRREEDPRLG